MVGVTYGRLALRELGAAQGLCKYPWPLAALADLPYRLGATTEISCITAWILVSPATDAGLACRIWRSAKW